MSVVKALFLLAGPLAALLVIAGCSDRKAASSSTASKPRLSLAARLAEARFIGDASCKDCHPAETAKQAQTGHAATLRVMDRDELGKLAPPSGRIPGSDIVLVDLPNGRYGLTVAGEKGEPLPLNFAVGSGKTGITHVAVMEDSQLLELGRARQIAGVGYKDAFCTVSHNGAMICPNFEEK